MSWTCPNCGRTFARGRQFHSHETVEVDDHFAGRPQQRRDTFDKLIASLPSDVRVEALRSVIVLSARSTFCYITVRAKRLVVGLFLEEPLDSPRVVKINHISDHKVGSEVDLRDPGEVDDEFHRWLRRAYEDSPSP